MIERKCIKIALAQANTIFAPALRRPQSGKRNCIKLPAMPDVPRLDGTASDVFAGLGINGDRLELHNKATTPVRLRLNRQRRIVTQRHMLDDRQPEAGALSFARAAFVDAVETLCQARKMFEIGRASCRERVCQYV